jgi:hypothetical protein
MLYQIDHFKIISQHLHDRTEVNHGGKISVGIPGFRNE